MQLQDHLSEIGEWAEAAEEGDTTTILADLDISSQVLLITSVLKRFTDLWAGEDNGQVINYFHFSV